MKNNQLENNFAKILILDSPHISLLRPGLFKILIFTLNSNKNCLPNVSIKRISQNEYISKILSNSAKKYITFIFLSFVRYFTLQENSLQLYYCKRNAIFDNSSINKRSQFPETVSIMGAKNSPTNRKRTPPPPPLYRF